jgi:TonB family protein
MMVLLLKVTLLWALALAIQPLLRRSSAAMRHLVYACGLAGALLLPLTLLAPPDVGAFRINSANVLAASRVAMEGTRWHVSEILAVAWAVGSGLLLLRIVTGHLTLSRLLREAKPLDTASATPVYFANISVPVVAGLSNPVILLPHSAGAWTASQRGAALKHEMQHVERKDLWTMTIGHLACAIYWFHPLAWAVARLSRQEQESACDDAVLASGFEPASYADALVAAARQITSTNLIGCHMLTRKTLKSRIARLFDSGLARIPSRAGLRGAAVASVAAIAFVGMLVGSQRAAGQQGASGQVFKVGGGVSAPSVRARFDPEYTGEAKDAKLSGTVLLSVVVGTDGIAHDINVVKPLGMGLDEKAVEAVQKWLFNPGMKNGEPVNVRAQIEINFRLQ